MNEEDRELKKKSENEIKEIGLAIGPISLKEQMIRAIFDFCLKNPNIHAMRELVMYYNAFLDYFPDRQDIHEALPDLIVATWMEVYTEEEIKKYYDKVTKCPLEIEAKREEMIKALQAKIQALYYGSRDFGGWNF